MTQQQFNREAELGKPNKALRTVPLTLSTEYPVDRGDVIEILDHRPGAVDLSRAPLPLIECHDQHRLNLGIVDQLSVEKGRLRGRAVFGKSARAQEVFDDVEAGIVRSVSIGYVRTSGVSDPSDPRAVRYKFQPHEVSLIAIPADPHAGFYRLKETKMSEEINDEEKEQSRSQRRASENKHALNAGRMEEIALLGRHYGKWVNQKDVSDAIERGDSAERFRELIVDRQQTKHTDTRDRLHDSWMQDFAGGGGSYGGDIIDGSKREWVQMSQRYSFARMIAAQINPAAHMKDAGLELEMSREERKRGGYNAPEGFYVPWQILGSGRRDFTMAGTAGGANVLSVGVFGEVAEALRPASALIQAGMRVLPDLTGDFLVPRVVSGATPAMLTEVGTATESDVALTSVRLTPHRLSTYVEASKQSIIQSSASVEVLLRDDLLRAAGALIDGQGINGAGTAAEMRGLRNTVGIGTSVGGTNGATVAWSHIIDLESQCANANAITAAAAGYLFNSKTVAKAKTTQKGTNLTFILDASENRVNGAPWFVANNLPSNLTKGTSTTVASAALFGADWQMAVLGLFGPPDITVDPYTRAKEGLIIITLNQFADFGVRQPAAFSKIEDLLTS